MIVRKVMLLVCLLAFVLAGREVTAQPNITGLVTNTFSPTNDPVLTWRISFDEPVTGVSPANFTLSGTGVTANIASVTALPGNASWNISADSIVGDGTLGVDLTDPTGITSLSGPLTQTYTGELYTVDNTSPYVVSITRLDPSLTLAPSVNFQITFNEPVYGVTASNFAPGGTAVGTLSNISSTPDPAVWTGTISGITGTGLLSLDLTDTSGITDAAGNWLFSDFTTGERYQVPPQLLCIARLDPEITSATVVRYSVLFNAPVNGLSAANIAATGPSAVTVTVDPNPAPAPAAEWIITVGGVAGDGTVQINLQTTSTVTEASGVSPLDFVPVNCNENTYQIDQTPPTANCVVIDTPASNATPTSATAVRYAIAFSDPVTGVSGSNFAITTTDIIAYTPGSWASPDGGTTWLLDITGIAEDTSNATNGRIEVALVNTDGILDPAGNQPALPAACTPAAYDFDQRSPGLICVTRQPATADAFTSASAVSFLVTFDEPVTSDTVSVNDFRVLLDPATGFISADITTVTAITSGGLTQQFIVDVSNIVGNNSALPPFRYNSNWSIGNGDLSVSLANDATILDETGNPVVLPPVLATDCGNTSYTIDQVAPRVESVTFANGDCLTSGIFTVVFTEEVTSVTTTTFEVIWTPDCHSTFTVGRVIPIDPRTYDVDIQGSYTLFHQNGPGFIGLRVLQDANVQDVAYNPLAISYESSLHEVCRCFEPAVGISPRAVLSEAVTYPVLPIGSVVCAGTDTCTSVGLLTTPYNDMPTTITNVGRFEWRATEWDCSTTAPFHIYLDEVLIATTDGGRDLTMTSQSLPGTTNSLCSPIGEQFSFPMPGPLTPGLHSYRIAMSGACTTDTKVFFNVLDRPVLGFPGAGLSICRQPQVFEWSPVDGAIGYELYFKPAGNACSTLIDRTTGTLTEVGNLGLANGVYEWYIVAYNEWGHQASVPRQFTVTGFDAFPPAVFTTDGTVYDIHVTTTTTYIAGDFTNVKVGSTAHNRPNFAAFNNVSRQVTPWVSGVNGPVHTIEADGDALYIGGDFTYVGATQVGRIARMIPDESTPLESDFKLDTGFLPGADDTVRAIEVVGDVVYYAGDFARIGTQVYNFGNAARQIPADRIATATITMTGEQLPPPASANLNPNASVYDLLHDGSHLYIGGAFSNIGGQNIQGLARATLNATNIIDPSFNPDIMADVSHYVYTMQRVGNRLYFGGSFDQVSGQPRMNAANLDIKPDGTTALGTWNPQPSGAVRALISGDVGQPVYIAGTFTMLRQTRFTYLAGVDPIMGYPMTCSYNADRLVYGIDLWRAPSGPPRVFVAGEATMTGN